MNREQRKRITQNITNLKERLVDLDPIIDRLIEKDVFSLEHREKIEHVSPATPQKKFNEFIQLLLASPEPNTYFVFLEALTEERHHYMAERLQNTVISGKSCTACSYLDIYRVLQNVHHMHARVYRLGGGRRIRTPTPPLENSIFLSLGSKL